MVADPPLRWLASLAGLVLVAALDAVLGQVWLALLLLAVVCWMLGSVLVIELRNRAWDRRVARWDRPEVWIVLDAVRDREHRRQQDLDAWTSLSERLAAVAEGVGTDLQGIALEVEEIVSKIGARFDRRFLSFSEQEIAAAEAEPKPEVRYL